MQPYTGDILMRLTLLPMFCVITALASVPPVNGHGLSQAGKFRPANTQERETPLDVNQVLELIDVMPDAGLASQIMKRGINFTMSQSLIERLNGAGPQTLTTLRTFLSNKAPEVSLRISDAKLTRGLKLSLNAVASDADGDKILYRWLSNTGNISGDGSEAMLDTSGIDTGNGQVLVTVSVTVSDRRGGFASDSKVVTIESERASAASANVVMSPEVWTEGKYLIVTLTGRAGVAPGLVGSIEVSLGPSRESPEVRELTGILPGVPCRVEFVGLNNIAESSFVEPPGIDNEWGAVVVRIKVKDQKRVTNFVIGWKLLKESSSH
jgi:hypothetical protein